MFTLEFETRNDAFLNEDGSYYRYELARTLEKVAHKVKDGNDHGKILDIYGNLVGEWELE